MHHYPEMYLNRIGLIVVVAVTVDMAIDRTLPMTAAVVLLFVSPESIKNFIIILGHT